MSETHNKVDIELIEGETSPPAEIYPDPTSGGAIVNTGFQAPRAEPRSEHEKRLLLKLDLVVLTLCCLMYFVAYLDRNVLGNARLMGIEKDLHLTANQFYNCLTMFFVGYIVFMLPGNILLRQFKPPYVFGVSVFSFGVFCVAMADAQHYATILVLRIFIGTAQAFIQGSSVYFAWFYLRTELATRNAIIFSFATFAGAFSGLISYAVNSRLTVAKTGREPWRWLFIIEGSIAMFVGLLTVILLPSFADQMKHGKNWLFNKSDVRLLIERAKRNNTMGAKVELRQIWVALLDPKSYVFALVQAAVGLGVSSVGNFLPTLVADFGYSNDQAQLFTAIPYVCAAVTTVGMSYISDRLNRKGAVLIFTLGITSTGYIILLSVNNVPVKVFATCLLTMGLYPSATINAAWAGINIGASPNEGVPGPWLRSLLKSSPLWARTCTTHHPVSSRDMPSA
ncbi:hypothetical protein CLAIMM_08449 [Cladophialophora immunda]|nr:hypothetical protein CLAIMM_08449 [Cladophialophora immunda]